MSAEATYLYKADLALLASDIEARAGGNPGALNVMCLGVLEYGLCSNTAGSSTIV